MWHIITTPDEEKIQVEHVDEDSGEVSVCKIPFKEVFEDSNFQCYMWHRLIKTNINAVYGKE